MTEAAEAAGEEVEFETTLSGTGGSPVHIHFISFSGNLGID